MTRWDDDVELLNELRVALAEEAAVTQQDREAAYAAFSWRTIDEELLALTMDSALEPMAAVRAPSASARVLAFQGVRLSVEIEVSPDQIMGQVVQAVDCEIAVENNEGVVESTRTDPSGFFALPSAGGLVRFAINLGESRMTTPWVVL